MNPSVDTLLETLARHSDPILLEMEARAERDQFPIIGPVAGRFLYQIAIMTGARRVFELGSGFGYSTLWFAKAVAENGGGKVHHTVWDAELSRAAQGYIARAGLAHLVTYRVSEAVEALQNTEGPFDLIFNDINKDGYPGSVALIKERLRPGGVAIFDNMLWHGRIFDPHDQSPATQGVRRATDLLHADSELFSTLIPLRDGLIVAVKH